MGFFPIDEETCSYLKATGRPEALVETFRNYFKAQAMFGIPGRGECQYSPLLELDLATSGQASGPKRPQDRIELPALKNQFVELLQPVGENGYNKPKGLIGKRFSPTGTAIATWVRDVVIAAITSCTNTSNPSVMLGAGLLAKKAVERGLSGAPQSHFAGARFASCTEYLQKTDCSLI
jgi:aconitate hydratase